MAIIQSNDFSINPVHLIIDPTSKAARNIKRGTTGEYASDIGSFTYVASIEVSTISGSNFVIIGNSENTVRITKIYISGISAGSAGTTQISLVRRTGVPISIASTITTVPFAADTNNPTPSAVLLANGSSPFTFTPGVAQTLWNGAINTPVAATAGIGGYQGIILDFSELFGEPLTLRGTNDLISFETGSNGFTMDYSLVWTEVNEEGNN